MCSVVVGYLNSWDMALPVLIAAVQVVLQTFTQRAIGIFRSPCAGG